MKKLLLLPIFAALMLSCSDDDSSSNDDDTNDSGCLECAAADFDFSVCDFDTFAQVTFENEDNSVDVKEITYSNDLDYDTLTNLSCDELNDLYVTTSSPTNECIECEFMDIEVDVCANEDEDSFTLTYDGKSASFDYEDGETFDDLNCVNLFSRALEILEGN